MVGEEVRRKSEESPASGKAFLSSQATPPLTPFRVVLPPLLFLSSKNNHYRRSLTPPLTSILVAVRMRRLFPVVVVRKNMKLW
jgi:hypothetical protein